MLRLMSLRLCASHWRLFHVSPASRDQVMDLLQACSAEDQVLEVVGRHKAKLSVGHVSCAMSLLWQFQKDRSELLRTVDQVREHPQFLTLRVLAENKINQMDDSMVVDLLYSALRLQLKPFDSLIQQLVTEAWNRLDRFDMPNLSKFSICVSDQQLHHSPLMGEITEVVSQKFHLINDARVLTTLMISISSLSSPRLRDALIKKADSLLDSLDSTHYNNLRRVVQFMRNCKHTYRPLLEKCNRMLLLKMPQMGAEDISNIMGFYQVLHFSNCDFRLASRQRLLELIDASTDPVIFTKLFTALGPMASQDCQERLERKALLLADELNGQQALAVAVTLEEIQCRNPQLINKIASILDKNLDNLRLIEISKMTQTLMMLHYQNSDLYSRLRAIMLRFLQSSVSPYEVTMVTRVLAMLPSPRLDHASLARVKAVLPQCNLNELNIHAQAIAKWLRHDPTYFHGTSSRYVGLLKALIHRGHERLGHADRLELLLEELRYLSGEWFEDILLEESVAACRRLADQVTPDNMPDLAFFLARTHYLCPQLLDRIAQVALDNIQKVHVSSTYSMLLPFALLNYDTPLVDDLFSACIQRFTPHISSLDPHLLVLLAYVLALAGYFPEEVIKAIFTVDFLAKLDSQLETIPDPLNMRVRLRLMKLNRAVCLECPEYQVPWFHERFCKEQQKRGNGAVTAVQQQIHRMLGEVLGGVNCVRVAVVTPYFYTVDYECVLDQQGQPVPYSMPSQLQLSKEGKFQWAYDTTEKERMELPPGAQRICLDFLNPRSFCKNSRHRKGEVLLQKRHLEILGYHVIQIPHYEWNSMELSTQDAWKEYLKKRIFHDNTP